MNLSSSASENWVSVPEKEFSITEDHIEVCLFVCYSVLFACICLCACLFVQFHSFVFLSMNSHLNRHHNMPAGHSVCPGGTARVRASPAESVLLHIPAQLSARLGHGSERLSPTHLSTGTDAQDTHLCLAQANRGRAQEVSFPQFPSQFSQSVSQSFRSENTSRTFLSSA